MEAELHIRVLKTLPELEEIRPTWEAWPGNRDSEMNNYLTFLRSSPGTERPHVLVVYRERRPDAILVGRIDRGHVSCRVGYLRLNLPAKILCFVYGGLRGNPSEENCDLLVSRILQSLADGEADVAYMNFLKEDSDLYRLATRRPNILCRDYLRNTQTHFAAKLPASVEEFYRGLSSGARSQAKSKQRKLIKDFGGDVRIRCFREVAELEDLVQDVEQVARTSYQRGLGVGFVDSPEARERLRAKAESGWLRAYVLYVAQRPWAFWIGDLNENTFGSDFLAYNAEFGKYSPGMFLITKVMEGFSDGNRDGITAVDFATGHAQYKEVLSNQKWRETSAYIFALSLKGISINAIRSLVEGTGQAIQKALARTNLLQKVKKAWRAHARSEAAALS